MRPLSACLSLVLLLVPGAAGAQAGARAERAALQKSERLLAKGDEERAVRTLARALRNAPTDALLARYAQLALPLTVPEDTRRAQALRAAAEPFSAALARRADWGDTLPPALALDAAWALALRGAYADSLALLRRRARSEDPRSLTCLRALAALALRERQPAIAREALSLARSLAPRDPLLATELGLLLLAEGDARAALGPLGERFARDPSDLSARRDLAYALSALARPAQAFTLLEAAGPRCAEQPSCLIERARWALEAALPEQALRAARAALALAPDQLDALFLCADAQLALGALREARATYQTILRIAPGNLRARNALSALTDSAPGAP